MSSAGSPKKWLPPCCSRVSRRRWIAPTEAVLTRPYCSDRSVGVLAEKIHQGAQVLQIEQQEALLVGHLEADAEDALLGLVQAQQPREQQRPHLGHRGPDRMALLAEQVPEHRRRAAQRVVGEADRGGALVELRIGRAGLADPGEVALDVGHEHRHAARGKNPRPGSAARPSCRFRSRRRSGHAGSRAEAGAAAACPLCRSGSGQACVSP